MSELVEIVFKGIVWFFKLQITIVATAVAAVPACSVVRTVQTLRSLASCDSLTEYWGVCFAQFFILVGDFIAFPMGLVTLCSVWRTYPVLKGINKEIGDDGYEELHYNMNLRAVMVLEFFVLIGDIICLPFLIAVVATVIRLPFLIKRWGKVHGSDNYDYKYRAYVFEAFFNMLLDLLFIPLSVPVLLSWRSKKAFHDWNDASTRLDGSIAMIEHFFQLLIDIPFAILFILNLVFIWRIGPFMRDFKASIEEEEVRQCIGAHFLHALIRDIPAFLLSFFIFATFYRFPSLIAQWRRSVMTPPPGRPTLELKKVELEFPPMGVAVKLSGEKPADFDLAGSQSQSKLLLYIEGKSFWAGVASQMGATLATFAQGMLPLKLDSENIDCSQVKKGETEFELTIQLGTAAAAANRSKLLSFLRKLRSWHGNVQIKGYVEVSGSPRNLLVGLYMNSNAVCDTCDTADSQSPSDPPPSSSSPQDKNENAMERKWVEMEQASAWDVSQSDTVEKSKGQCYTDPLLFIAIKEVATIFLDVLACLAFLRLVILAPHRMPRVLASLSDSAKERNDRMVHGSLGIILRYVKAYRERFIQEQEEKVQNEVKRTSLIAPEVFTDNFVMQDLTDGSSTSDAVTVAQSLSPKFTALWNRLVELELKCNTKTMLVWQHIVKILDPENRAGLTVDSLAAAAGVPDLQCTMCGNTYPTEFAMRRHLLHTHDVFSQEVEDSSRDSDASSFADENAEEEEKEEEEEEKKKEEEVVLDINADDDEKTKMQKIKAMMVTERDSVVNELNDAYSQLDSLYASITPHRGFCGRKKNWEEDEKAIDWATKRKVIFSEAYDATLDMLNIFGTIILLVTLVRAYPFVKQLRKRKETLTRWRTVCLNQILDLILDFMFLLEAIVVFATVIEAPKMVFRALNAIVNDRNVKRAREIVDEHFDECKDAVERLLDLATSWNTYKTIVTVYIWGIFVPAESYSQMLKGVISTRFFRRFVSICLLIVLLGYPLVHVFSVANGTGSAVSTPHSAETMLSIDVSLGGYMLFLFISMLMVVLWIRNRDQLEKSMSELHYPVYDLHWNLANANALFNIFLEIYQHSAILFSIQGFTFYGQQAVEAGSKPATLDVFPGATPITFYMSVVAVLIWFFVSSFPTVEEEMFENYEPGTISESPLWQLMESLLSTTLAFTIISNLLKAISCVSPFCFIPYTSAHYYYSIGALLCLGYFVPTAFFVRAQMVERDGANKKLDIVFTGTYTLIIQASKFIFAVVVILFSANVTASLVIALIANLGLAIYTFIYPKIHSGASPSSLPSIQLLRGIGFLAATWTCLVLLTAQGPNRQFDFTPLTLLLCGWGVLLVVFLLGWLVIRVKELKRRKRALDAETGADVGTMSVNGISIDTQAQGAPVALDDMSSHRSHRSNAGNDESAEEVAVDKKFMTDLMGKIALLEMHIPDNDLLWSWKDPDFDRKAWRRRMRKRARVPVPGCQRCGEDIRSIAEDLLELENSISFFALPLSYLSVTNPRANSASLRQSWRESTSLVTTPQMLRQAVIGLEGVLHRAKELLGDGEGEGDAPAVVPIPIQPVSREAWSSVGAEKEKEKEREKESVMSI